MSARRIPYLPSGRSWQCRVAGDLGVSLVVYRGAEVHEPHRHDCSQLTIQLAGALEERIGSHVFSAHGAMIGFKPAGAVHADRWGSAGALLFTVSAGDASKLFEGLEAGWSRLANHREIVRHVARLPGAGPEDISEAVADIAALCDPRALQPIRAGSIPPAWLSRTYEALCDDPAGIPLAALSEAEGVHRVHLARSFRQYFGVTPSYFRRSQMTARLAASLAGEGASLAECAHESGFCDQSHSSRVLRGETGLGLSQLRALFRARRVSFVQDRSALAA